MSAIKGDIMATGKVLPEANFVFFYNNLVELSIYNIGFLIFDMRYIEPTRVKVLMMMFFATGIMGVIIGLSAVTPPNLKIMITLMSMINIGLGAFFTFLYLTQIKADPDKRKKKKKPKSDK